MGLNVKNSSILQLAVAIAIITIPAIVVGLIRGIQYIGPLATVITVVILAVQAWYNKKTAELMKQSMMLSLRREHTEQLRNEVIEPLYDMFSQLEMGNNKLIIRKSEDGRVLLTIIDPQSLIEEGTTNKESWKFILITFANLVNSDLNVCLLYDLIEYHLPKNL
ncbi:hypothetical protein [Thermococcus sp.]